MTPAPGPGRRPAEQTVELDTAQGPGRIVISPAVRPVAILALGHGAGGGIDAPDLVVLADRLPAVGITVLRVEQPWRTAGRRVAVAPPRLDQAWLSMLQQVRSELPPGPPWLVGGRSAGARVACRTADAVAAVGVVCLAFPLHPPGRSGSSRAGELLAPGVPRLVLQGTRDRFGAPTEVEAVVTVARQGGGVPAEVTVVALAGADHGLRVRPRAATPTPSLSVPERDERVVSAVAVFARRCAVRVRPGNSPAAATLSQHADIGRQPDA